MINLLRKEFKLSVHPTSFIFLSFGLMLLIPNYPYYVAFFYQTLAIFLMFMDGNATNDIFFTTLLPIRKVDAVKARVLTIVIIQVAQLLVSIPFAFLRYAILPAENLVGMDANPAFFGFCLLMFAVFNLTFLPMFYKTAYKSGTPFLISTITMTLAVGMLEAMVNLVPGWKILDTVNSAYLPQQMLALLIGILGFAGITWLAYKQSAKNFAKIDL